MGVLSTGTAARPAPTPLLASPATQNARPLLARVETPARSREGKGDPSETHSRPLTTAETDKLIAAVFARHTQSFAAADAYDDLNHALFLIRERGDEVPCVGPGAEAWTSDDPADQELASDRCLDCPAMLLCKEYADLAQVDTGTWGGETRQESRTQRRRRQYAEARARKRGSDAPDQPKPRKPRHNPPVRNDSALHCTCGCGGTTRGGYYLAGHDSRHLSVLVARVSERAMTLNTALAEVAHSERLQATLRRHLGD